MSVPPSPLTPESGAGDDSVAGVLHVHTTRSDGGGSPEAVARAAAHAGLKFVILTDHGDATRKPDPPSYNGGVLVIDGVEISTDAGHLLALGLPQAPYPLAGEARDVIEDIHRLGGQAIAAHPDSPKADLAWEDWEVPLDGAELVNLDTMWRVRASGDWRQRFSLLRALSTYPLRPAPTMAALTVSNAALLERWSAVSARRPLRMYGGADAHARLDLQQRTNGERRIAVPLPSYEAVFRTMTTRVRTAEPLTGDADHDARQILAGLAAGHAYLAFDAVLTPPSFAFEARTSAGSFSQGEIVVTSEPVTLAMKSNAPLAFKAVLFRNGEAVQEASAAVEPTWTVPAEPATYHVELHAGARLPEGLWVVSNPIFINPSSPPPVTSVPVTVAGQSRALFDTKTAGEWTTEAATDSRVAVDVNSRPDGTRELLFRYGLPGGAVVGQYAAAVVNTSGGIQPHRAIVFTGRADKPMRLSVQVRQEGSGGQGWRWQRTVYLDSTTATHVIPFDDFRPMGPTLTAQPPLEHISSILLAVDQTNTAPGSSGRVWFQDVTLR